MKRIWMSVKQLADEFGVSVDSVYRAYRNGRYSRPPNGTDHPV